MTAARYDITIDQGSDFALELIVKESGNAKNFTDDATAGQQKRWGARASFRKNLESTTSVSDTEGFQATVDLSAPTTGKVKLSYPGLNSKTQAAGTYLYDLEIYQYDISSSALTPPTEYFVTRLIGGNLTLRREVTR